jgi:GxxExxY protein
MVDLLHGDITREILSAYFDIRKKLPWGMHEHVYANAMCLILRTRGIPFEREVPMTVSFLGEEIGHFRADLVVAGKVIVELKSVERLSGAFEAQLINYLATTGLNVGLLLNFGLHGERRRVVWTPSSRAMEVAGDVRESHG